MISTIKNFSVGYNPINQSNVFCSGDYITGQVSLELTKGTKVNALSVKLKGEASVLWTEENGKNTDTYKSKEKYFSIEQFLIQRDNGNNLVAQGSTVYPFTFQIPAQDLPQSFNGTWGKIKYTLEANLARPMRLDSKARAPQHGVTDKKLNFFNSGYVTMDVKIDKTGFHQGEGIKVVTSIHNKSTRDVRPKYCVYTEHSFFAKSKRKMKTKDLLKEVGDTVPPSSGLTVTKIITIPTTTCPSLLNCSIIKVEYRLRVYLDVKYALDPQITFPIIILPAAQGFDTNLRPIYGFESSGLLPDRCFLYVLHMTSLCRSFTVCS
uniref:Arrestin C-terminal-like domain-containing protein n=1 Tax=Periophthalmus magnuspinnatus TaxID=409849 RepID=A0A3B4AJ87_9GOBI